MKRIKSWTPGIIVLAISLGFLGCNKSKDSDNPKDGKTQTPLFTLLPAEKTKIDFANTLTEGLNTNVLMYEYFYNGGGVAAGDLNGDGLDDIYFTGNMVPNKLYLNKGQMAFEDITATAGVGGRERPWKTGVTLADVNGDGKLDIYVSYSGNVSPESLKGQLFINKGNDANGIPQFEESAEKYGLGAPSNSTQAAFFDFDKDGDMDMFLLNHNPKSLPILDEASTADILKKDDPLTGVRFFKNDPKADGTPYFTDITKKAGIQSSPLTYGLGIGIADVNQDGWQDMYISNDYSVPDFLYINNKNGTFTDALNASIGHTSHSSMGNDIADFNNDGLPDIFTLDMLPEDNRRQKLLAGLDNYELFDFNVKMGFHHQYMRNMLQLNQGQGGKSKVPVFSEVGQLSGVSNTDWSWASLFADYDNDGWKDLFITNGNLRDFTNMDFVKFMGDHLKRIEGQVKREDVLNMVYQMPSSNMKNYLFQNKKDLTFTNVADNWGLGEISNSGGAAYSDLDNDGDLDLIVNNINKPAFIYQNDGEKLLKNNYLKIKLEGDGANKFGIGAKVTIYNKGQKQYLEQMPTRGYQSSVSPVLHFGLGKENIDSLQIVWLSGKRESVINPKVNALLTLAEKNAKVVKPGMETANPLYNVVQSPIAYNGKASTTNDFKRQPLLINPISFSGPCLIKGDVNGDGLEDIFAGGGSGEAGKLYLQQKGGTFTSKPMPAFEADKQSDDTDAVFFDANGDGFQDLFVGSGGYATFMPEDPLLQSRLYLNDGKGNFSKSAGALPKMITSTSCVRVADVNGDNKPDLFVGGRVIPGRYPETPRSYVLINDGSGKFSDQTANLSAELANIGLVTDAAWTDLNGDKKPDLIVVGEWMPITVYINVNGKLENKTSTYFDKQYSGWWNKLLLTDLNGDGKDDLVIGNLGLNSQCKASDAEPVEMIYKDFDDNGSIDPIMSFYIQGKSYPYVTRDEMLDQMSIMRTRFQDYKTYADATVKEIFTADELEGAKELKANYLKTAYFEQGANGKFAERPLPFQSQISPVYTITAVDFDKDGNKDLLLCGNVSKARLRFGKYDANFGVLLKGNGKGGFAYIKQDRSGFNLKGDVRSVLPVGDKLLFGINQQEIKAYQIGKVQ
ncbi:VCBS repeat-containing protein [Dyadobacter psychrophilus]|uniref:Repeat domain-containing protein n=1 Tax=Dyadobacter psychrophilus TaxID=651661 RepID=A0A1T5CEL7_9BACT|nr:VCBS repeat-containing protein [Dyadobacter psychrophilus]SKB57884.1 Repeat domain-containing protein [Dyadobacter psychrophilus]